MNFNFGRVRLLPEMRLHRTPLFDVAMIGHLQRVADLDYFFSNPAMLADIRATGYSELLDLLHTSYTRYKIDLEQHRADKEKYKDETEYYNATPKIPQAFFLQGLPIPLRSLEEFEQLFPLPEAAPEPLKFISRLGGNYPWLPLAIADFFQAQVMLLPRRLWIIAVPQALGVEAFMTPDAAMPPASNAQLDTQVQQQLDELLQRQPALLRALDLPNLGLLCLPDFERLHVPPSLIHIPRLRIANPLPAFLPCSSNTEDGVIETSQVETEEPDESVFFVMHLQRLLRVIARFRRDVNLLLAFPFDVNRKAEVPRHSLLAIEQLQQWQKNGDANLLRHVQLVFPYLQDVRGNLSSPCALLAGQTLATSTRRGEWRSIAGIALPTLKRIFPVMSLKLCAQLREAPGLAVLREENAGVQLDDERIPVPYVADQPSTNSGELARFMGGLQRALENLGLSLVFENQYVMDQSEIVLRDFFTRLHTQGALRGRRPEDAFNLRRQGDQEGVVVIEIDFAPAIALDRIQIDLRSHQNSLQLEVRNG